jgi:hypothetical protein
MNEIFNTLRDKFPFLSLIRKGDLEYVGIVQNQDTNVISFYDFGGMNQTGKYQLIYSSKVTSVILGQLW